MIGRSNPISFYINAESQLILFRIPIVESPDNPSLLRKRRKVSTMIVHVRQPVPCCVLELLPLVVKTVLQIGTDELRKVIKITHRIPIIEL